MRYEVLMDNVRKLYPQKVLFTPISTVSMTRQLPRVIPTKLSVMQKVSMHEMRIRTDFTKSTAIPPKGLWALLRDWLRPHRWVSQEPTFSTSSFK